MTEPGSPAPSTPTWRQVHRITPLLEAWKVAVALIAIAVARSFDDLRNLPLSGLVLFAVVAGGVLVAILISLGYSYLAWRRLSFAITADSVLLRSGVLFRRERVARLTRIQSVEITQPILGRIFGFSALRIESAGGDEANLSLQYLTQDEARGVRNEVLARAAGLAVDSPADPVATADPDHLPAAGSLAGSDGQGDGSGDLPQAVPGTGERAVPALVPEAPEHQVFALATSRLIVSLVLGGATVVLVIAVIAVLVIGLATGDWGILFGLIALFLSLVGFLWGRFAGEFGLRVATSPDGLRVRSGLLETKARTIPPGRIQEIKVSQPLLWRRMPWWRVQVTLARTVTDGSDGGRVLLPVGTFDEAQRLVRLALPQLDEVEALKAGLIGTGDAEGWVPSPQRSRWFDPISYRRNGFRVFRAALAFRRGRLWRVLTLVPHERTQSLGIEQGPLDRRLDLVAFRAHTAGSLGAVLPHLDSAVAARLLAEQSERARSARRLAGPERWMRRGEEPHSTSTADA